MSKSNIFFRNRKRYFIFTFPRDLIKKSPFEFRANFLSLFFVLRVADKTIKLWKVSERDKRAEGYNLKEDSGLLKDPSSINTLRVPVLRPMELMVEASPRRIFANAHTYHINSISVNSDGETYLSADDLR